MLKDSDDGTWDFLAGTIAGRRISMNNKRIVVALGRNAFGETFPEQQANVKKAAKAIDESLKEFLIYQSNILEKNGGQLHQNTIKLLKKLEKKVNT